MIPLHRILIVLVVLSEIGPASSFARNDPGDLFVLPDFAQRRDGLPETESGTPGGAYCGPASSIDILQWLNDNGYPGLGVPDTSNAEAVTLAIGLLGILMGTDPNGGTGSQAIVDGLQLHLDLNYSGRFTVNFVGRSSEREDLWRFGHSFDYVTTHLNMLDLVLVNVGWYKAGGMRCGGHWVAMTGYDLDNWPDYFVSRYCDPAREANTISTKNVIYEQVWLEDADNITRHQYASNWNWLRGPGGSGLGINCDSAIGNRNGVQDNVVTIGGVMLFSRVATGGMFVSYNLASGETYYHSSSGTPVAMALHPFLYQIYHCEPGSDNIFKTDIVTDEVTTFDTSTSLDRPRRLTFGSSCILYVLQGSPEANSVVALGPAGNLIEQATYPEPSALAYHEKQDRVFLWSGPSYQMQAFTDSLVPIGPAIVLPPSPAFVAPGYLAVDPTGEVLFYNHDGSSSIYRYDLQSQAFLSPIDDASLTDPAEMALDNRGHLYVASGSTGPVHEFDPDGMPVAPSLAENFDATEILAMTRGVRRPLIEVYIDGNTNADRPIDPGDFNGDLVVDMDDYPLFEACFSGSDVPYEDDCEPGDFDGDNDIDCADWDLFVLAWTDTASAPPGLPQCAEEGVVSQQEPAFRLAAGFPNPCSEKVTIDYTLAHGGEVRLTIHDAAGRFVATLVKETREAGDHSVRWDGRDHLGQLAPSGVYIARLKFDREKRLCKLVLVD